MQQNIYAFLYILLLVIFGKTHPRQNPITQCYGMHPLSVSLFSWSILRAVKSFFDVCTWMCIIIKFCIKWKKHNIFY